MNEFAMTWCKTVGLINALYCGSVVVAHLEPREPDVSRVGDLQPVEVDGEPLGDPVAVAAAVALRFHETL